MAMNHFNSLTPDTIPKHLPRVFFLIIGEATPPCDFHFPFYCQLSQRGLLHFTIRVIEHISNLPLPVPRQHYRCMLFSMLWAQSAQQAWNSVGCGTRHGHMNSKGITCRAACLGRLLPWGTRAGLGGQDPNLREVNKVRLGALHTECKSQGDKGSLGVWGHRRYRVVHRMGPGAAGLPVHGHRATQLASGRD